MSVSSKPVSSSDLSASRVVAFGSLNLTQSGDIILYIIAAACACATLRENLAYIGSRSSQSTILFFRTSITRSAHDACPYV